MGADVRYSFLEHFQSFVNLSYLAVTDIGDLRSRLGGDGAYGLMAQVGASATFFQSLQIRLTASYNRYQLSFANNTGNLDQSASGGTDQLLSFMLGLAYQY
jgi:hypothetical protein